MWCHACKNEVVIERYHMNADRVGKKESDWNDMLIEEMDSLGDAKAYSEASGVLKDNQTGQCGINNGGIGVPGAEDNYSNPLIVPSLPSVRSCPRFYPPPCSQSYSSS